MVWRFLHGVIWTPGCFGLTTAAAHPMTKFWAFGPFFVRFENA
jgi:hypothetical protein